MEARVIGGDSQITHRHSGALILARIILMDPDLALEYRLMVVLVDIDSVRRFIFSMPMIIGWICRL